MTAAAGLVTYNLLVVVSIWAGAVLAFFGPDHRRFVRATVSFSAGIFLGVAFLHMIPEAIEILDSASGYWILAGFVLFNLLERFVMTHPCEEDHCDYHRVGLAALLGLSLHSVMNGIALGSSLLVPGLGLPVLLATLVHKAPESYSLTSLLLLGKGRRTGLFGYVAVLSVMVPLGTLLAYLGLASHGSSVVGAAVALSAGTFLQIATGDLLPEMHGPRQSRTDGLIGFFLGLAAVGLTRFMGGH
jgi:zinc and cadmium transporter